MDEKLEPSRANPLGRQWYELDFQARLDVLKEKVNRLADRPDLPARGQAAPVGVDHTGYGMQAKEESPVCAEQRALKEMRSAFEALVACPSGSTGAEFTRTSVVYQDAWMAGRKRVTIAD